MKIKKRYCHVSYLFWVKHVEYCDQHLLDIWITKQNSRKCTFFRRRYKQNYFLENLWNCFNFLVVEKTSSVHYKNSQNEKKIRLY